MQDFSKECSEHVQRLMTLIKDVKVAMLTTTHHDGSLRSRPMMVQDVEKTRLWFFTNNDGEKYYDIVDHSDINLSFSSPEHNHYISISGTATFIDDRRRIHHLWTPFAKAWFPDGPDDPKLSLMMVEIRGAEYWDVKSGVMVQLIEYVKASFGAKNHEHAAEAKTAFAAHAKLSSQDLHA